MHQQGNAGHQPQRLGASLLSTPHALPAAGNAALAQAMCGAVVDVAAMVVALPPPGAAASSSSSSSGAGGLPPHPAEAAPAAAASEAAQQHQQALLLPYPAALRHNDCHYVHQARPPRPVAFHRRTSARRRCPCCFPRTPVYPPSPLAVLLSAAFPRAWRRLASLFHPFSSTRAPTVTPHPTRQQTHKANTKHPPPNLSPQPPCRPCATCPTSSRRACSSWCTAA